jgi:hypothetical protein
MAAKHALITGDISGPIPTPDPSIKGDFVDVTPGILYFDDEKTAVAVAEAIEVERYNRGSHPLQLECAYLDDADQHPEGVDPERRKRHQAQHKALTKKVGP